MCTGNRSLFVLLCWPLSNRPRHHHRCVLIGPCWLYVSSQCPPLLRHLVHACMQAGRYRSERDALRAQPNSSKGGNEVKHLHLLHTCFPGQAKACSDSHNSHACHLDLYPGQQPLIRDSMDLQSKVSVETLCISGRSSASRPWQRNQISMLDGGQTSYEKRQRMPT